MGRHHHEQLLLLLCLALFVASAALSAWRSRVVVMPPLPPRSMRRRVRDLRCGDLLLWSRRRVQSDVSKFVCGTPYTHVSVAFVDAAGKAFHFEVRSGQVSGLHALRVDRAAEDCVLRQLVPPLRSPRALEAVARRLSGQRYTQGWWRGVLRYVPAAAPGTSGGFFCSQLVAETYAALGVLDYADDAFDTPPSKALPAHFSAALEHLPLAAGHAFGPEERLLP